MKIEKLDFKHRDLLFERLKKTNTCLSEYSFANIYLFRERHNYEIISDEEIFIKGRAYDGSSYLMPTKDIRNINLDYLERVTNHADFLFPVPEEWLTAFDFNKFKHSYHEGDSDYIYSLEKISTYKGSRLHKKRNLLKQFLEIYKHNELPLTNDRMDDAKDILEEWQKESLQAPQETDFYPCEEAFDLYDELFLCGGIYYVENEPAGFIIGEEMCSDMFTLHFVKAKKKFKGIYQYMYNNFAKILPAKYKFLNFEQDLGKAVLKIAKSSYAPDKMLKKYRVALK